MDSNRPYLLFYHYKKPQIVDLHRKICVHPYYLWSKNQLSAHVNISINGLTYVSFLTSPTPSCRS